jgi:hypothetical protein
VPIRPLESPLLAGVASPMLAGVAASSALSQEACLHPVPSFPSGRLHEPAASARRESAIGHEEHPAGVFRGLIWAVGMEAAAALFLYGLWQAWTLIR